MWWPKPEMWDCTIDYVRLTTVPTDRDEDIYAVQRQKVREIVVRQEGEVPSPKAWGWLGYNGENYGLLQVGAGLQGTILQGTQWAAHETALARCLWDNVSRLDIALTLWYDRDNAHLIRSTADHCAAVGRSKGVSGRGVRFIDGYGKGDTCYVGARTSDVFLRIYDKGREQGKGRGYDEAIRIEFEFKGAAAPSHWSAACELGASREYLAAVVVKELQALWVSIPGLASCPVAPPLREKAPRATDESRIAWLANQVRPSIDRLLASGYNRDYIVQVLGLGDTKAGE